MYLNEMEAPLADKYVYNSPYAFAENKLGRGVELEGLELGPFPSNQSSTAALGTIAEGFRQYVQAGLSSLDRAYLDVSASIGRTINKAKVRLGITNATVENSVNATFSIETRTNLGEFFGPPVNNQPLEENRRFTISLTQAQAMWPL